MLSFSLEVSPLETSRRVTQLTSSVVYIASNEFSTIAKNGVADVVMFNRDSFPLLVGTAVFAFEGVGLQVTAHLSRRLQVADKQGHSHYPVDEGTKEVPWCTIWRHVGCCHSVRWSRCSRIHGIRIRYSNRRPRQPTPR